MARRGVGEGAEVLRQEGELRRLKGEGGGPTLGLPPGRGGQTAVHVEGTGLGVGGLLVMGGSWRESMMMRTMLVVLVLMLVLVLVWVLLVRSSECREGYFPRCPSAEAGCVSVSALRVLPRACPVGAGDDAKTPFPDT
eukprot:1011010-Rhodomonas_salina.1